VKARRRTVAKLSGLGAFPLADPVFISPIFAMDETRIELDDKRWSSISSIEERADRAAEEWFESHSRPPPLKKHLQASVRKRRVARRRDAAGEPEALAER
jgi:hypothetical protein